MNAIRGGFSRLYRGSWPQGEIGWTMRADHLQLGFRIKVAEITG